MAEARGLNRSLGWTLLIIGFAWAAWLDPWSLGTRDPTLVPGSARAMARHAQAVVLGMALLQLAVARVMAGPLSRSPVGLGAAGLTAAGALAYSLGYILRVWWPVGACFIPAGALLNFLGLAVLAGESWRDRSGDGVLRLALPVIAFGMLLDTLMGLFAFRPELLQPAFLGAEDGLRLRMLRLARAAAIALPILALLFQDLAARAGPRHSAARWGRIGLVGGAVGMPLVLTTAALTSVQLKYLLPLPADAVFLGAVVGVWLARRHGRGWEAWGWLLVATSMAVGLLMGAYAFDGPLRPPGFLGEYNDFPRRLTRLGHAYAIVLGLLCLFVALELDRTRSGSWARRLGAALLAVGVVLTVGVIGLVAAKGLPTALLGIGPALVAVGLALCVGSCWQQPARAEPGLLVFELGLQGSETKSPAGE